MSHEIDLKPYLEDLERRIQPEEELRLETEWLAFADGKCVDDYFAPLRKAVLPDIEWPHIYTNDAINSYDLMILHQLKTCSENLRLGGGELLSVRSNYGTGIIPTMFGAELFFMERELDTLPGSRPLPDGKDGVMRILAENRVDYSRGLAVKTFEMAERYLEVTKDYPNISRFVNYYNPDLQGPLPLVEMLWGTGIYMDFYEEPEKIEEALDFFTDVFIDFSKKWKTLCPDFDDNHAVEWGLLHKGGTVIRNDSATNISGDMYEEYVRSRDQRVIDTFGGCIHFCGRGDHYIDRVGEIRGISGINMSQPNLNDMEVIYQNTVDKGLVIIGMPEQEVERAVKAGRPLRGLVHCGASIAAWEQKK